MPLRTVCLAYQRPNVIKSLINELSTTFRGHLNFIGQKLPELEVCPMDADYYIVPSAQVAEKVEQARPGSSTMVTKFTLNVHQLPRLLTLKTGTRCLVVAGSQETAENAIQILNGFGFDWLYLSPYWPGKQTESNAKIAITPGSPKLCPDSISTIIDLGPRTLDIVTLIRICLDLNLPRKIIDDILISHFNQITGLGRDYLALYKESEQDRAYLNALIDSTKDAIAAFNTNDDIMHSNTLFRRMIEGANLDLSSFLENLSSTPSVEKVKGKYFVVEKFSVNLQEETYPIGTLLVMRSTEKVSKAEGALRRAIASKRHIASYHFQDILGVSSRITKVVKTAKKIAARNLTVMITGETGTGKELFAHAIHNASPRSAEPFVCTHFSTITNTLVESELFGYDEGAFTGAKKGGNPGYFELAHKGTLFLDEIGDLPANFQSHLLRVLEDKRVMRVGGNYPIPIDVRLIAATNKDLESLVKQGRFREDLFYRLNIIPLLLPPLRSRAEDIPILATHFLRLADKSGRRRFSPEVHEFFQNYLWPGNIRQLKSVVNYMVHTSESETLEMEDLPASFVTNKPETSTPNELTRAMNKNSFLIFLVLNTLDLLRKNGKNGGKKAFLARAKAENICVSDYQMRKLLHELKNEGLISIGSTSQGTVITEKGLNTLNSISAELTGSPTRSPFTV